MNNCLGAIIGSGERMVIRMKFKDAVWKKNGKNKHKTSFWKDSAELLLDLFYPPSCPLCDEILKKGEKYCCKECGQKLPWIGADYCLKCGKPVSDDTQEYCPDCLKFEHYFDQGTAPFVYKGDLRHSIYRMKHENRRDYIDFYAWVMAASCKRYLNVWRPDLILAVPMQKKRKRKRGYNQSELLGKKISQYLDIPFEKDVLQCTRQTEEQKTLGRKERMKNLRGSFSVKKELNGIQNVLIADDVYTTGSTMDEISRVLKQAGVKHVFFVVLCTGKGKNLYP